MKPSNKGWIKDYLTLINSSHKPQGFNMPFPGAELVEDQKLYRLVQPSGLMYGYPLQPPGNYQFDMNHWTDADKTKFVLLDCLVNEALLFTPESITSKKQFEKYMHQTIQSIYVFYQDQLQQERKKKPAVGKSESEAVESILHSRVQVKAKFARNFWAGFFQNSLLFLDVYYFGQWLHSKSGRSDQKLYEDQENLRFSILQTIASAAWANDVIEEEEKALFNFFLQSANLEKEKEKWAREMLKSKNRVEHLQIIAHDAWIIKKYLLELAILTIWADRQVESSEKEFVKKLSVQLGFAREELDASLLAVESFVMNHWNEIHFLQSKHDLLIVKDHFSKRLVKMANKHKKAFVQEVRESKELMQLIMKMTREKLSDEEQRIVRAQLLDLLKTLPTFVIIALPGTFITLPLLLKLLPKKAFPSAFAEAD